MIDELIAGQFAGEDIEEEINEELDALLAAEELVLPEVPADKIPEVERQKEGFFLGILLKFKYYY